jgi:hypothetical protein
MKNIFWFALIASTSFTLSCATDQAAKQRSSKPATVGIWGGAYRPTGNVGVVADLAGAVSPETDKGHFASDGSVEMKKSDDPNTQSISTRQSGKIDVGVHIYPMQTSGFFYGLGASKRKKTTSFDTPNVGSSLTNPSYSNVAVTDDIYAVGPSIGWDWIWPNGISALLDLGPRWDVNKSRSVDEATFNASNIDAPQRDKLLKKIDNNSGFSLITPRLIVGYSF